MFFGFFFNWTKHCGFMHLTRQRLYLIHITGPNNVMKHHSWYYCLVKHGQQFSITEKNKTEKGKIRFYMTNGEKNLEFLVQRVVEVNKIIHVRPYSQSSLGDFCSWIRNKTFWTLCYLETTLYVKDKLDLQSFADYKETLNNDNISFLHTKILL